MAKIEKKVPFDPATITVELDPEVEGGVILTRGDTSFAAPLEDLYQLAAGERGDWQEYQTYWDGSTWTDTSTSVPGVAAILDGAAGYAAAGGGLLRHPGMGGGLI